MKKRQREMWRMVQTWTEDAESWKQSAEASAEEEDLQRIWRCQ